MKVRDLINEVQAIQGVQLDEAVNVDTIKTFLNGIIDGLSSSLTTEYRKAYLLQKRSSSYKADGGVEDVADMKTALTNIGILKYGEELYKKAEAMMDAVRKEYTAVARAAAA